MKIILLSGGSGKRLWPLSNDARSKQFLRLLPSPNGGKESMIQRVIRQIKSAGLTDDIIVATGDNQKGAIENQLSGKLSVVTEPCRRDTFPAILLACSYLAANGTSMNEPVIVMPCDSYTEDTYFSALEKMANAVEDGVADIILMGIQPTYPSSKYGYIVPKSDLPVNGFMHVKRFTEKPDVETAKNLVSEGALWNGGVFAFKLDYIMNLAKQLTGYDNYEDILSNYATLTKISFDYAVVEKAQSVAVIPYAGVWKDLGTWNTLTDELEEHFHGNVLTDESETSYIFNELGIPIVCIGADRMVVAASPDGILVSTLQKSENLKNLVGNFHNIPMYEEYAWGEYRIVSSNTFNDGFETITKEVRLNSNCSLPYCKHNQINKVWNFIDGEGEIVLDGIRKPVKRGDVISIASRQSHGLKASTSLTFIEVVQGTVLQENNVEFLPYKW